MRRCGSRRVVGDLPQGPGEAVGCTVDVDWSGSRALFLPEGTLHRLGAEWTPGMGRGLKARFVDGALPRVVEGVTIGLVVAGILLAKDGFTDYWDRRGEIAYIRGVIVSGRLDVSKAQAGSFVTLTPGSPPSAPRHRSRADAQLEAWRVFTAELSDVLAYRTSRLTYDEKRELPDHFPGNLCRWQEPPGRSARHHPPCRRAHALQGPVLPGREISTGWSLPPAPQEVEDGLVPADRPEAGG